MYKYYWQKQNWSFRGKIEQQIPFSAFVLPY